MCPHCRAFITSKDRICPYCNEAVGPRAADRRDPGQILGGFIPHARFVTVMILLVNFGLFVATSFYSFKVGEGQALVRAIERPRRENVAVIVANCRAMSGLDLTISSVSPSTATSAMPALTGETTICAGAFASAGGVAYPTPKSSVTSTAAAMATGTVRGFW